MTAIMNPGRRAFLKATVAAGGGLLVAFYLPGCERREASTASSDVVFEANAWLRIAADDSVTIRVASSEMGQGVMTAIPMLIAEELDADWSKIQAEMAPAAQAYFNPLMGRQHTGGSTAVRGFWTPVRQAGAAAREMLRLAAAQTWGVPEEGCRTEAGAVLHPASGRRLSYGALADKAAGLPVPEAVFLKEPDEFRLVGKALPRVDTPSKVNGSAAFGQDANVPGMLVATVLRCPVFGGKVKQFNAAKAKAVAGVRRVLQIESGVAVVADNFWSAKRGRDALEVQWDEGPAAGLSSAVIRRQMQEAASRPGEVARQQGDMDEALTVAAKRLDAVYEVPYLAHACMEPMNCTAHVRAQGCDVWVGTQGQTLTQQTAMRLTGLPAEKVNVHTLFLGGGFGRRSEQDFVADALELSKAVGAPVKVMWTREDDIRHDYYRPATYNVLSAGMDERGSPTAWSHRIVGPSIFARFPARAGAAIDRTSVEGAANIPYAIPNLSVTYTKVDPGIPVGFWRSVGSSQNAFVTECFLDELAALAGKDPYELRGELLAGEPRHKGVLELAARKAGWSKALPEGRHRGIAVAAAFGSVVAQVAEISITDRRQVRVHRVVCAIDCGMIVNPDTIEAQMQSGIVYGLTAALKGQITIKDGRVEQGNFNDYPLLRMDEMPEIEVHIMPSTEPPGGVGEPGTPPIAPAVANAVFAATGKPVRRLPIRL